MTTFRPTVAQPQLQTLALLASEGARFDNAFTVATGTTPSHSSLFTSSHAMTHGVYNNETILSPELTTLAEVLSQMQYETAAFVSAVPVASALGLSQGFQVFDENFDTDLSNGLGASSQFERSADRTTSTFLEWLDSRDDEPFFAWIHYFDPHQPYAPSSGKHQRGAQSEGIAKLFEDESGAPKYVGDYPGATSLLDILRQGIELETVIDYARLQYRGEIANVDAASRGPSSWHFDSTGSSKH
ncbi:MAG TPA: sulfatase-like hydrolase/transferase [Vicinamibacteria bacterium]